MTLQEAKSIARHLGLTLRKVRSSDYRVNFRDGDETMAHYTDNLEDAVNTAVEMARKRDCERRTVQSRSVIWHHRKPSRSRRRDDYSGSDEQMFGAKQQIPGTEAKYKATEPAGLCVVRVRISSRDDRD
jgi:hypothetical protein